MPITLNSLSCSWILDAGPIAFPNGLSSSRKFEPKTTAPLSLSSKILPFCVFMFITCSITFLSSPSGMLAAYANAAFLLKVNLTFSNNLPPAPSTPLTFLISSSSFSVKGLTTPVPGGPNPPEAVTARISVPRKPNWEFMANLNPSPKEIKETTAAIPMNMPSIVSQLLNLLDLKLLKEKIR